VDERQVGLELDKGVAADRDPFVEEDSPEARAGPGRAAASPSSSSIGFLAAEESRPARFTLRPITVLWTVSSSSMKRARWTRPWWIATPILK